MNGLNEKLENCNLCPLLSGIDYALPRIKNGDGIKVMIIGEAPGREEATTHMSFVGRSGEELNRWVSYLHLNNYYITNVVKHRPTFINPETGHKKDRPPSEKEISACKQYLEDEIKTVKPDLIITLGYSASHGLESDVPNGSGIPNIPISRSIPDHIQNPHYYRDTKIRILNLFHPSYILREYNMPDDKIITNHMHYLEQVYNIIEEMKGGE